jgi:hypothetical protein
VVKQHRVTLPRWERFSGGDSVPLGAGARFAILHAEAKARPDPSQSSNVILVELGATRAVR